MPATWPNVVAVRYIKARNKSGRSALNEALSKTKVKQAAAAAHNPAPNVGDMCFSTLST
jgi:hypothetical protein